MLLLVFTYSTVSLIRVQGPFSVNKSPIAIQGSNISNYIFISSAWYMTHTKVCIFPIYISGICFRPRVHPLTLSPLFYTKSPPLDIEPTVVDKESPPGHWAPFVDKESPPGHWAPFVDKESSPGHWVPVEWGGGGERIWCKQERSQFTFRFLYTVTHCKGHFSIYFCFVQYWYFLTNIQIKFMWIPDLTF